MMKREPAISPGQADPQRRTLTGWANFRSHLGLYLKMFGISVRAQMQYRASFLLMTFGSMFATTVEFLGIWALFARFGTLRNWTLPEIGLFYGVVNTAFAITEGIGRGFDTFENQVKSGDFDRLLLRPLSPAFQVAAQEVQMMRAGRLTQALVVMTWSAHALPIRWTLGKILLLIGTVAGGSCLFYGLFVLQATLSFWTVESLEVMNTVTYGGTETAQYPLSIYRHWFRSFFTFVVPLASINILPMRAILPRTDLSHTPLLLAWLSPLIGLLFLLVALQVWKLGVRHYRSSGS